MDTYFHDIYLYASMYYIYAFTGNISPFCAAGSSEIVNSHKNWFDVAIVH